MARVFISYRRTDARWAVGRLYDRLSEALDRGNLFLDVSDIEPGEDYVSRIEAIVGSCDVLLAVIGRDWLTAKDSVGRRRIDDPLDWVRVEISTALSRGIRVIPILIDEADMPNRQDLPDELGDLCRRNAKLVSFTRFHADLDSLLRVLEKVLRPPTDSAVGSNQTESKVGASDATDNLRAASVKSPLRSRDENGGMPLTVCIETLGGVATPLIYKGTSLPTEESQTFSTAADNQETVTVTLVWGERENAKDNLPLGTFNLDGIPPADRGVPQIEVTTSVDQNLIMTVTARDLGSGRNEVLDAVDLSVVEIPDDMQKEAVAKPRRKESFRDFEDIFSTFGGIFGDFRQKAPLDPNATPCSKCNGTGQVDRQQGFFTMKDKCPDCGGTGKAPSTES